jgi:hypothetical protein
MPVIKCSNGKYRIGSSDCIYDTEKKATEVWQAILASGKYAEKKVSYDYDDTLSTEQGKAKAKRDIAAGYTVYIISARNDKEGMLGVAKELGILESRVYATGSNKAKVEKIKELGISIHTDNNQDVIDEVNKLPNARASKI